MKYHLLVLLAVCGFLGSLHNSHASLARVAVLGSQPVFQPGATQDQRNALNSLYVPGALWYDDDYNLFLNPVVLNDNRDFLTLSAGGNLPPQGGVFGSYDYFTYGFYLNRSEEPSLMQPGAGFSRFQNVGGYSAAFGPDHPLEIFLGADFGIKYGLHLVSARRHEDVGTAADRTARYWRLDLGAEVLGFQPFVGFNFASQYEDTSYPGVKQTIDQLNTGFKYRWEAFTPYFIWNQQRESIQPGASQTSVGSNIKSLGFGMGHDWNLYEGVHVFSNLGFWRASIDDTSDISSGGFNRSEWTRYVVPLNLAVEAELMSWLVVRAGLTYDLINSASKKMGTTTINDTYSFSQHGGLRARIGSMVTFKQFSLEGGFGKAANTDAVNVNSNQTENTNFGLKSDLFAIFTGSYRW